MVPLFNISSIFIKGLVVISTVLALWSCELDDPDVEITVADIITLSADKDSLEADGQKTFILTAELQDKTDQNKEVTFHTSYGTFTNGDAPGTSTTKIMSSGRVAIARLKVTTQVEGRIFISAELGGYACDKEIKTTFAYPTSITISIDDPILLKNRGNVVTATAMLERDEGTISDGIPVRFSFVDLEKKGLFLNYSSLGFTSNQIVSTAIQSVNDSIGPFRFIATIPTNNIGDSLRFELNLVVQ